MGWIGKLLAAERVPSGSRWDEAVVNGAPYHPQKPARSSTENSADGAYGLDAQDAEEIKRRQVSLAIRYVAAVRAR